MDGAPPMLWLLAVLGLLNLGLIVFLLLRKAPDDGRQELIAASERVEREVRREIAESSRADRQELALALGQFQQNLTQQSGEAIRTQNAQIDAFAQQLALMQKTLADTLATQLQALGESNARRLSEVRATLETQLAQLQQSNAQKLDEMRKTVDEQLQTTLQTRLGESFKQVAERLEQVHRGLGEMQTLAQGVGDLKHLLSNVKSRGVFGEAQLGALLEQVFTVDQYAAQVATRPGSKNMVDFAVRLPGRSTDGTHYGCRLTPSFPMKITNDCSTPRAVPMPQRPKWPAKPWRRAFAPRRAPSPRSIWSRRTRRISPSCFCPPRACTPRSCAAPA